MIGRDFTDFDAMIFNRCNSIHTMFMKIALDVLFIDRNNAVCGMRRGLQPWHPLVRVGGAWAVIELPSGAIDQSGTELGDLVDLNAELDRDTVTAMGSKEIINPIGTAISYKRE